MSDVAIEKELKKRLEFEYSWGRKQVDEFDKLTNFIYKISLFDSLLSEIETKFKNNSQYNHLKNYALNRWFNFWSAKAIETILDYSFGNISSKSPSICLMFFNSNFSKLFFAIEDILVHPSKVIT